MPETNPTIRNAIRRCAITVGVAIVALTLIVLLRPKSQSGVPEAQFWINKFDSAKSFDIVLAGDSRILRGVSSGPFADRQLGSATNFGFRGAPLNTEFLSASVARLKKTGPRIMILGVTPNAFTQGANISSGYTKHLAIAQDEIFEPPRLWHEIQNQLRPMSIGEMVKIARGTTGTSLETFHPDGWVQCQDDKPNENYALPFYEVRFDENRVSEALIEESLESIEKFAQEGVLVFGVQPPIPPQMKEIENRKSGFDYARYTERFQAAGGIWLAPDVRDCKTYDGSHLNGESAVLFSERLADAVKKHLATLQQ